MKTDDFIEDFERLLRDAAHARARRAPRRAALRLTVALAVAGAVIAVVASGGDRPTGEVAAPAQAPGEILHMRIRTDRPKGFGGPKHTYQESWSAREPRRWRLKQWAVGGSPLHRGPTELAYGAGEHFSYERKRLTIRRGAHDARFPSFFSRTDRDPDVALRELVDAGKLTDEGELQVGGRTVRRLVKDDGVRRTVYDVDPQTFVPLAGTTTYRTPKGSSMPPFTAPFVVEAYERLPLTPETERRLRIDPPAGTKTTIAP